MDDDIVSKCSLDDITVEVAESTEVSTRINQILAQFEAFRIKPTVSNTQVGINLQRHLEQTSTPHGSSAVSRLNTTSVSNTTSSASNGAQGVKLPKIQLQKFRGDITKFQLFWQSFRVAVDGNEGLSKAWFPYDRKDRR